MATRHTPRRRHGMRAAAVAFVLATALTACKKGGGGPGEAQAKEPEVEAIPVEVVKAANRPIAASYTGTAPLDSVAESQVVAKTSGVALAVLAEEGDHVRAGQVLVRLDPDRARLQAAQSAALRFE